MLNNVTRPHGMSQLDYLWLNFGGYEIHNEASGIPQENVVLSEKGLASLLAKSTGGGITELTYRDNPLDPNMTQLIGTAIDGSELTVVEMPKEVHVAAFASRKVTQEDIDNGCPYAIATPVISILLTNGKEFLLSTDELAITITGGETDTIQTNVVNGVVKSSLKVDTRNNEISAVELKNSTLGVYLDLKLSDKKTGVTLTKDNGLGAEIPLGTTGYDVKFDNLSLSEYLNLPYKDPGTLYFITDIPYIFLGNKRYGVNLKPGDAPIVALNYDPDKMLLAYKKSDESDIKFISLGPVSEDCSGMMSKEQYIEFLELKNALDGIVSVSDYVQNQIKTTGIAIEWGEVQGTNKELLLKNGYGDTISKVLVETENYLQFAVNKIADSDDVIAAAKNGVLIREGAQILILTLTSGSTVYVDLTALVDSYITANTRSINMQINASREISAELNISENDKMLYVYGDGLASHIQIVRQPGKVTFYGRTLSDKLGEFEVGDSVIKTTFIPVSSEETHIAYPPRNIDGKPVDRLTNPFIEGVPYLITVYGTDTGDISTSYTYNDYLSVSPILNSIILSKKEGNLLSKDSEGFLYCGVPWKIIN